jgi:hypothetical protein
VNDSEPQLAVAASNRLWDLSGGFPLCGVGCDGGVNVVPYIGAEVVVDVSVIRVLDIELWEKGLAVWSCRWSDGSRHNSFYLYRMIQIDTTLRES